MAALPSDRVYQGFWMDYSQDSIHGAKITTSTSTANLIIAVLSLLVVFTGAHLWDLIAFTSYWLSDPQRPRSYLLHQRQVLARNLRSPGSFALASIQIAWSWRRKQLWSTLGPMTLLALSCSGIFLVAGIFVSLVVSSSNIMVLAHSTSCGFLSWTDDSTYLHRQYQQAVLSLGYIYSQACYNKTGKLPQCNIYAQKNVPIQQAKDAECPFPGLCTSQALSLDTGLLDSNTVFGMNTPASQRVQMQRVITCSPVNLTQFFSSRPAIPDVLERFDNRYPLRDELLFEWSMGLLVAEGRPYNSTFWMSSNTSLFSRSFDLTPRVWYAPVKSDASRKWQNSTFVPLPILQRDFADTHFLARQNDEVLFWTPNDDPLFSAHKKKYVGFDDGTMKTMYIEDEPATFLGCTEQFNFCFSGDNCTGHLGFNQACLEASKLAPTHEQNVTFRYLLSQIPTWYRITTAPMQVTKNAASFQLGVPPDQWKIEVFSWFNFLLAVTQIAITHLATGPGIIQADLDQLSEPPELPSLCHAQRMVAPGGYSNINVLGLALVLTLSTLLVSVNMLLLPLLKFAYYHSRKESAILEEWVQDQLLH